MVGCSVLGCKSRSERKISRITFHSFPCNPDIRSKWVSLSGKLNWTPTKSSKICSIHFNDMALTYKNKFVLLERNSVTTKHIHTCVRAYLRKRSFEAGKHKPREKIVTIKGLFETGKAWKEDFVRTSTSKPIRNIMGRLSSTSLAGSFIKLPKYVPYSVHEITFTEFEEHEKVHKNIDYTLETHFKDLKMEEGKKVDEGKKIVFHEKHIIRLTESCSIDEGGTEVYSDEEFIEEDVQSNNDATEEPTEESENIITEKLSIENLVPQLASTESGKEKRNAETAVDETIEENITDSEVSSDNEVVEEENNIKTFDEELNDQDYVNEEIIELSDDDEDDQLEKTDTTSNKKLSIIAEETP